jgi:hypothetical protein
MWFLVGTILIGFLKGLSLDRPFVLSEEGVCFSGLWVFGFINNEIGIMLQ